MITSRLKRIRMWPLWKADSIPLRSAVPSAHAPPASGNGPTLRHD